MVNSGPILDSKKLKKLVKLPYACVFVKKCERHIALSPSALDDIKESIRMHLSRLINRFDSELDAVVLGYRHIHLLTDLGTIFNDAPHIHIDVEAEFYLFKPQKGDLLEGVVNKKSGDNVSCLIHDVFNASIPIDVHEKESLQIGQHLTFQVECIDFSEFLPYIRGKLVNSRSESPSHQVENEAKRKSDDEQLSRKKLHSQNRDSINNKERITSIETTLTSEFPTSILKKRSSLAVEGSSGRRISFFGDKADDVREEADIFEEKVTKKKKKRQIEQDESEDTNKINVPSVLRRKGSKSEENILDSEQGIQITPARERKRKPKIFSQESMEMEMVENEEGESVMLKKKSKKGKDNDTSSYISEEMQDVSNTSSSFEDRKKKRRERKMSEHTVPVPEKEIPNLSPSSGAMVNSTMLTKVKSSKKKKEHRRDSGTHFDFLSPIISSCNMSSTEEEHAGIITSTQREVCELKKKAKRDISDSLNESIANSSSHFDNSLRDLSPIKKLDNSNEDSNDDSENKFDLISSTQIESASCAKTSPMNTKASKAQATKLKSGTRKSSSDLLNPSKKTMKKPLPNKLKRISSATLQKDVSDIDSSDSDIPSHMRNTNLLSSPQKGIEGNQESVISNKFPVSVTKPDSLYQKDALSDSDTSSNIDQSLSQEANETSHISHETMMKQPKEKPIQLKHEAKKSSSGEFDMHYPGQANKQTGGSIIKGFSERNPTDQFKSESDEGNSDYDYPRSQLKSCKKLSPVKNTSDNKAKHHDLEGHKPHTLSTDSAVSSEEEEKGRLINEDVPFTNPLSLPQHRNKQCHELVTKGVSGGNLQTRLQSNSNESDASSSGSDLPHHTHHMSPTKGSSVNTAKNPVAGGRNPHSLSDNSSDSRSEDEEEYFQQRIRENVQQKPQKSPINIKVPGSNSTSLAHSKSQKRKRESIEKRSSGLQDDDGDDNVSELPLPVTKKKKQMKEHLESNEKKLDNMSPLATTEKSSETIKSSNTTITPKSRSPVKKRPYVTKTKPPPESNEKKHIDNSNNVLVLDLLQKIKAQVLKSPETLHGDSSQTAKSAKRISELEDVSLQSGDTDNNLKVMELFQKIESELLKSSENPLESSSKNANVTKKALKPDQYDDNQSSESIEPLNTTVSQKPEIPIKKRPRVRKTQKKKESVPETHNNNDKSTIVMDLLQKTKSKILKSSNISSEVSSKTAKRNKKKSTLNEISSQERKSVNLKKPAKSKKTVRDTSSKEVAASLNIESLADELLKNY